MRSKLRSCPVRGWVNLTVCTLGISVCFFSCTISADAGATRDSTPASIESSQLTPRMGAPVAWPDAGV